MPATIEKIPLPGLPNGVDSHALRSASPRTSLSCFLAGTENLLAVAAVRSWMRAAEARLLDLDATSPRNAEISKRALDAVSPLVLHGASGCGKSHLARGLANWLGKRSLAPGWCLTAAELAGQYIEALENDAVAAWRQKTRAYCWLVLEDLWQIASKTSVQQELVQLLDACERRSVPVAVTFRTSPAQTPHLLPALASRLSAGLSAPIEPPALATRRALLEEMWAARGRELTPSIPAALDLLAEEVRGYFPDLQGALNALEHRVRVDGRSFDVALVRHYLEGVAVAEPTLRAIAQRTARHFDLTLAELKSPSRRRGNVAARNVAMYLARKLTDSSLEQIGAYFGGRDHTTVMHGCRQAENLVATDPVTRRDIATLRELCSSRGQVA